MSAKYFVAIRPRTNDFHSVHKEGCPFMPDVNKGIYLGSFKSDSDAESEGRRHFSKSMSCPFCSKEKKLSVEIPAPSDIIFNIMHYPEPAEQAQYECMFCCVN
jgi:hypothetical protein